ncbi:sugar transferase [Rosettibacter firmus]|uniref:sugar transferase n=1 Tax=Rosettibacter firmus TaxID=3111522 RepID=UPI00336BB2F5
MLKKLYNLPAKMESRINKYHNKIIKKFIDIVISIFLFVILLPIVFIIIFSIVKLTDGGSVLFKQKRFGYKREIFTIYKFRSMNLDGKEYTKYGNFIRKRFIDEIPQIINVLKGEMSVVGPRPHAVEEDLKYSGMLSEYNNRYEVLPGITGWAQVNNLRGKLNDELIKKRLDYDLWYIRNWSLWLDVKIIFMTLWKMIKGDRSSKC